LKSDNTEEMDNHASSQSLVRSVLWQSSFAARAEDTDAEIRCFFRDHLLRLRKKATLLVAQAAKDIPQFTVHDITHLDAIWELASLIAGPEYRLNPAEAYVFGASVLLHDAAMSLAAYPGGLTEIQRTDEWGDAVAVTSGRLAGGRRPDQSVTDPAPLAEVIPEVLRALHAKHAAQLPATEWRSAKDGSSEFLIDDPELRSCYGPVIGRIARSHNDPVSSLPSVIGNQIGAFCDAPSDWVIDPVRLALLLRCADAAHIDHRRAPGFLQRLVSPERASALHWAFQNKLAKPRIAGDALVFSSGPDFGLDAADAWFLCFETVRMIDRELRDADRLLETTGRRQFAARRVVGAESPLMLAGHVRTAGWEPIDAELKISDVRQIVTLLGGRHLYGDNNLVPVRELIQNAADAVRARRLLQPSFQGQARITCTIRDGEGYWLEVEDNGVGMSRRTLTDSLLDFGRSFWTSAAVREEFPGLLAKGLTTTGRFGVGFYSVFMLGDAVRVTSRRYDSSLDSALTLEFRSGIEVRPIVRPARSDESLPVGGTRVSVRLKDDPYTEGRWLSRISWKEAGKPVFSLPIKQIVKMTLAEILAPMCPSIDVPIYAEGSKNEPAPCINADDWLTISPEALLARLSPASGGRIEDYAQFVRPLADENGTYGRACIHGIDPYGYSHCLSGIITVGGLSATPLSHIAGILEGSTDVLSRYDAVPNAPLSALRSWAGEQAALIGESTISDPEKLRVATVVLRFGADPGQLPIAKRGGRYLNAMQAQEIVSELDEVYVFEDDGVSYDEDLDECHPKEFAKEFELSDEVFFASRSTPGIFNTFLSGNAHWPDYVMKEGSDGGAITCLQWLARSIRKAWGTDPEEYEEDDHVVGAVNYKDISRKVLVFARRSD
jgi:Histidine kinase-, DNA gyrase B-, and HSP90-like ATPase